MRTHHPDLSNGHTDGILESDIEIRIRVYTVKDLLLLLLLTISPGCALLHGETELLTQSIKYSESCVRVYTPHRHSTPAVRSAFAHCAWSCATRLLSEEGVCHLPGMTPIIPHLRLCGLYSFSTRLSSKGCMMACAWSCPASFTGLSRCVYCEV